LFVALNLPRRVRQELWDATAPLRALGLPVRWVREDALHLTLKFLGEVAAEREAEVVAALGRAAVGARPLSLVVRGLGVFPDFRRPRVVWLGVEGEPALELLQHRLEQELGPLGFPPEGRPFRPHLTLGRAARDARPRELAGLEAALGRVRVEAAALVETLDLMESTLTRDGAVYEMRHSERLS
jgi:2'-5' RNA ligase